MLKTLPDLGAALVDGTFLAMLPVGTRELLLADARVLHVPSGSLIFPASTSPDQVGVLTQGTARTFLHAGDGRRLTVRFAKPGDLIGSLGTDRTELNAQAVTDCTILEFDPAVLRRLLADDPQTGMALIDEIYRRLLDAYATLAANTFGTMRERVARLLLDAATADLVDGRLLVPMTQQGVADGVGSVREVVARVLREFRDDGLIATTAGEIEILDVGRLAAIVGRWTSPDHRERLRPTIAAHV